MNKYVFLTFGFEKPTPQVMAAWGAWFKTFGDKIVDKGGHFRAGREVVNSKAKDLPLGADSTTGYTVITAESLDAAEAIAKGCPSRIRVYELMSM
jgi:hypothetical protein